MSSFDQKVETAAYPFNLGLTGNHKHDILPFTSCNNDNTKADAAAPGPFLFWMQHGWVWYWAFNHEEAALCFGKAIEIAPHAAMAHWGLSMCHGPNYNSVSMTRDGFPSAKVAYASAQQAFKLATSDVKDELLRHRTTAKGR